MQAAAACDTVNVCEAMVSVPDRGVPFGFAATVKPVEPLPVPLAPLVTVIQAALLEADHGQPAGAVTLVEPAPPAAVGDRLFVEMLNVHPTPACVTVSVCPATVTEPTRWVALEFPAALKPTDPTPLPVAPFVTVSHPVSLLAAVHEQPDGAVTVVEPFAMLAPTV